jgi:hypothetical protein
MYNSASSKNFPAAQAQAQASNSLLHCSFQLSQSLYWTYLKLQPKLKLKLATVCCCVFFSLISQNWYKLKTQAPSSSSCSNLCKDFAISLNNDNDDDNDEA